MVFLKLKIYCGDFTNTQSVLKNTSDKAGRSTQTVLLTY
jgi:hypothetical protein